MKEIWMRKYIYILSKYPYHNKYVFLVRETVKKVLLLMAGPLRGKKNFLVTFLIPGTI